MARLKKKKPLRGSIRQNIIETAEEETSSPRMAFGVRLALMVLGAIASIFFISWVWNSEWPRTLWQQTEKMSLRATQKMGFSLDDVIVDGRRYTNRSELYFALEVRPGNPIFAFDPQAAHDNIMKLPWTQSVTIMRSLPNKLIIKLKEREPMARWQNNDKTIVIDAQGQELTAARAEQFAQLPLVVGEAAPEETKALLIMLQDYPAVSRVLKAAVRVGERRWNFYLQPNLLIRMPEHEPERALMQLSELIEDQKILDRAIVAVDLRFPDRMVIEPADEKSPTEGKNP